MDKEFVLKVFEIENKLMLKELRSLRVIEFLREHLTSMDIHGKIEEHKDALNQWRARCGIHANSFDHNAAIVDTDQHGEEFLVQSLFLQPKVVSSSNLALRFYLRDQWTKAELDACCKFGEVLISHPKDGKNAYFTLADPSYSFDIDKLMKLTAKVDRAFNDYPNESDYEFLKRMNGG